MKEKKISADISRKSVDNLLYLCERTGMSQSDIVDGVLATLTPDCIAPLIDLADEGKTNIWGLIRDQLDRGLYPHNKDAKNWVMQLHLDTQIPLTNVFEQIFVFLAAGIDGKSVHDNGYPIVQQFARTIDQHSAIKYTSTISGEIEYMHAQWSMVRNHIARIAPQSNILMPSDATFATRRYGELLDNLFDYWTHIKDYTYTYRLLASVARVVPCIDNSSTSRYNLRKAIIDVSAGWES